MIIPIIIGIIFIIIIVLFVRYLFKDDTVLVNKITEGCCQLVFSSQSLPLAPINGGLEYTFSFWIYIASFELKYNQEKVILYWKGKHIKDDIIIIDGAMGKCLEREQQKLKKKRKSLVGKYGGLKVALSEKDNDLVISQSLLNGDVENIVIKNVPMQKWINIIVMLKLRQFDVFLNGALYGNKFLKQVPLYGPHKLIIDGEGGFDGYISNVKYFNRSLAFPEIKSIWKKGYRN